MCGTTAENNRHKKPTINQGLGRIKFGGCNLQVLIRLQKWAETNVSTRGALSYAVG
jgi:hypothetical protein